MRLSLDISEAKSCKKCSADSYQLSHFSLEIAIFSRVGRDSRGCSRASLTTERRAKKGCETAPYVFSLREKFKVTHPFHPLHGREFDLLNYSSRWGWLCVEYRGEDGEIGAIPVDWTDAGELEPFVEVSEGRSHFRVGELLELVELLVGVESSKAEV